MLPNWLYGKSKSKLAELLGGGGAPSDYNQVKAQVTQNTEDIASLDDAKAAITQISNPNLLDNPWFTINQRGQSSYSGTAGYSYDRWYRQQSGITVSLDSDECIVIQNTDSDYGNFKQPFSAEFIKTINGRTLTLSVLFKDGTIKSNTSQNVDLSQNASYCSITLADGAAANIRSTSNSNVLLQIAVKGGITIPAIRAFKLELGSVSTLAMDTEPNYAAELLKCQRYFVRVGSTSRIYLGTAIALDNDKATAVIKLPTTMRAAPSVTGITNLELSKGSTIAITALDSRDYNNGYLALTVSASGTTAGSCYLLRVKTDTNIDFSANL